MKKLLMAAVLLGAISPLVSPSASAQSGLSANPLLGAGPVWGGGDSTSGGLRYDGSATRDAVPKSNDEARRVFGKDVPSGRGFSLSPYGGLGYRYLYGDTRGAGPTAAPGYRSEPQLVMPLGLSSRINFAGKWSLAPTAEYNYLPGAKQFSRPYDASTGLSDTNQKRGYGYRFSLMVEKGAWAAGPWMNYWNIDDSGTAPAGQGLVGPDAKNWTREFGLELRYRFNAN